MVGLGVACSGLISPQAVDPSSRRLADSPLTIVALEAPQPPSPLVPITSSVALITYTLGYSTQGWPINVYQFGNGPVRLAFVGGIHGGYEWNTILLAYQVIDYLTIHPETIPLTLTVFILPAANPDGLVLATGNAGRFTPQQVQQGVRESRFNGNKVDLNRNWDCRWSAGAVWQQQEVSGGTAPFSEVETQLLARFLTDPPMDGVVLWHSAANAVLAGGCNEDFAEAVNLGQIYAEASGYPFKAAFTSYVITGDAADWLSLQAIPAIEIELRNRVDLDWEMNLAGILAVLKRAPHWKKS
jgi:predicted deacylase